MLYETLTDLLNNDPAAYEYFYALPAEMQTALRQQGSVHSLPPTSSSIAVPRRSEQAADTARAHHAKRDGSAVSFSRLMDFLLDAVQQPDDLREPQQHGSGQEPSYQGNYTIVDHAVAGTHQK